MSAAIGVAIAALSATMNAVGVNLQRLGKRRRSPLISATGVLMAAALCPIADMTSFTFAPQSLIAPVAPLCLLVNLALAPLMHGTSIHLLDVGCTVLVFSGVFVCLQSASSDAAAYSYAELTQLAAGTAFRTWAGLNLLVATGLASRVLRGGASAVAYACLSGLCGGCTMLCGKLLTLLGSLRAETGLMPLALVGACAAVFGLSQIATMNAGLDKHSPLVLVPFFISASMTTNAIGGGILFAEFAAFTRAQWIGYPVGLSLLLGGVLLQTLKPPEPKAKGERGN